MQLKRKPKHSDSDWQKILLANKIHTQRSMLLQDLSYITSVTTTAELNEMEYS